MSADTRTNIHIDLTALQRQQVSESPGGDVSSLDLETRELEQRISPSVIQQTLSSAVSDVIKNIGQALNSAARG